MEEVDDLVLEAMTWTDEPIQVHVNYFQIYIQAQFFQIWGFISTPVLQQFFIYRVAFQVWNRNTNVSDLNRYFGLTTEEPSLITACSPPGQSCDDAVRLAAAQLIAAAYLNQQRKNVAER